MRDDALFYTCSLLEYIGRECKLPRDETVDALNRENIESIYRYADVLHCEPIAKIADEYITRAGIPRGSFDNVATCRYHIPDYWTIGDVYTRLIEDVNRGDILETLWEVYHSVWSDAIQQYNSDFYYQPRDYIRECYLTNSLVDADN